MSVRKTKAASEITVTSSAGESMPLYATHALTATYTGSDSNVKEIVWSMGPESPPVAGASFEHSFVFGSNPTPLVGGKASTTITVFGQNANTDATVYARSLDPDYFALGSKPLTFTSVENPPVALEHIVDLVSLDGNPLSEGEDQVHLFQVACRGITGGRFGGSANWSVEPNHPAIELLGTGRTMTDGNYRTTNAVIATGTEPVDVTVTATMNPLLYSATSGSSTVRFQSAPVKLPGQGSMTITSKDGDVLLAGVAHEISVLYRDSDGHPVPDNTEVTWSGFPSGQFGLLDGEKTKTTAGIATNHVMSGFIGNGDLIDVAVAAITTTAFNPLIGTNDYGSLTCSIQQSPIVGIEIDKAYAKNPKYGHGISWKDPSMAIKCQLQVLGASGSQTVLLPTDQEQVDRRTVEMVDATGKALVRDSLTGYCQITTNGSDPATFFVGSPNPTRLTIGTQWQGKPQAASAKFVLATNVKTAGDTMPAPTIQGLQGKVLQVPGGCPAPAFKVNIPKASGIQDGDTVALLLNDRLVYHGPAAPALSQSEGVDVAYAALKLGTTNNLVYVAFETADDIWGKSLPFSFTVDTSKGQPQTGPCPGLPRELKAPQVDVLPPIGAIDILPSLDAAVQPYPNMTPNDDVITVFFYLQGADVFTKETTGKDVTVNNIIVSAPYRVTSDSPLVMGNPVGFSLPQWAAAGYANGQLQIDYRVASQTTGTRWSRISPTSALNTTIPFTSS